MYHTDREDQAALRLANVAPEPLYEADPEGDRAGEFYENVQVLGDLSTDEFNLFMASITEWVSPEAGLCLLPQRGEPCL
jgi:photosynthetic reaction center cytochrome c subunit